MNALETIAVIVRNESDTYIAFAFRKAVGLSLLSKPPKHTATHCNAYRYAGARSLMRQRYGVRL